MTLKSALVAAGLVLAAAPASAHGWGGRGFGFFPFFVPPPVYYYPPPYYAPPPAPYYPPPAYVPPHAPPPVYKDQAPLPHHESSDDKQWRKQTITRIGENNVTVLNDGECYLLDYHVRGWQVGDEVLVTNDRSELINQSRGNEGASIEMIGEKCVQ